MDDSDDAKIRPSSALDRTVEMPTGTVHLESAENGEAVRKQA